MHPVGDWQVPFGPGEKEPQDKNIKNMDTMKTAFMLRVTKTSCVEHLLDGRGIPSFWTNDSCRPLTASRN
ncbi:hypothetical protein ILYODFUR_024566 [Ilyodon furcidens]|uniref:Uncharacterized protein n=2 Tax=Goodeidae TaxID=28758 RepID=A0ABV0U845_9TELE